MSKYVNKKHGLIIGSDNIFFITNDEHAPEGVKQFRDGYRAIVWAKKYSFTQINSLNVFIRTPAEQLIWNIETETVMETIGSEKFGYQEFPIERHYPKLREFWVKWLNTNIGPLHDKWDIRSKEKMFDTAIFFRRRKDALAFIKKVEEILDGCRIRD
jgi:hypothetical protein